MKRVDDGISARLLFRVTRRQEHDHVAIDSVALEIALKRRAMDLDVLDVTGFAPGTTSGTLVCTCAGLAFEVRQ